MIHNLLDTITALCMLHLGHKICTLLFRESFYIDLGQWNVHGIFAAVAVINNLPLPIFFSQYYFNSFDSFLFAISVVFPILLLSRAITGSERA